MSRDQHDDETDRVRSRDPAAEPSVADSDESLVSDSDESLVSDSDESPVSDSDEQSGRRDVVVPLEIYKVVTVFSTLIAVPAVVLGFMFLDAATLQVSFMRGVVLLLLSVVGLGVDTGVLSAVLAIVGLLLIAFGAGVYVLGARFRAEGMGNAEEDATEHSTNG